jgi:hypothetical protein
VKADWLVLRQIGFLFDSEYLQIDDGTGFRSHAEASLPEEGWLCGQSLCSRQARTSS